jgi:hypothetical protein
MAETIYSVANKFFLEIDGTDFEIREPIKWNNAKLLLDRQKDEHGFELRFPSKDISLEVSDARIDNNPNNPSAKELVDGKFYTEGVDAMIILRFQPAGFQDNFRGKIDMSKVKVERDKTSFTVKRLDEEDLYRNNDDVNISMEDNLSIDGNDIGLPQNRSVEMHSKAILQLFRGNNDENFVDSGIRPGMGINTDGFVQIGFGDKEFDEIQTNFNVPTGQSIENPLEVSRAHFKAVIGGTYTVKQFRQKFRLRLEEINFAQQGSFRTFIVQTRRTFGLNFPIAAVLVDQTDFVSGNPYNADIDHQITSPEVFEAQPDDFFFFYTQIQLFVGDDRVFIDNLETDNDSSILEIEALTVDTPTFTDSVLIFDGINHVLSALSNQANKFRSNFFGPGGGAEKYVLTSGNKLRQIDKAIRTNAKELYEGLQTFFNIGLAFEEDELNPGSTIIRWENIDFFYQDVEILQLQQSRVSEYEEEVAKDLVFNEVQIEYPKIVDEELNTQDEFNTERNYLTSIRSVKKKYKKKSKLRAAGYDIEYTRRKRTTTESFKTDDNNFLIAVSDSFTRAEKDEAFETIDNVIQPETVYNARLEPARCLFNHASWLNSGQFFKPDTESVKNTLTLENGEVQTRFKDTEPNLLGDTERLTIKGNQDFTLAQLSEGKRIFRPIMAKWKVELTPAETEIIIQAYKGKGSAKYGYISVPNNDGEFVKVYLDKLEGDPNTNIYECEGKRKSD